METLEPPTTDQPAPDPGVDDAGLPATRQRRSGGRRTRRMAQRRKVVRAERWRQRGKRLSLLLAAMAVGVGLVVIGSVLLDNRGGEDTPVVDAEPSGTAVVGNSTVLLIRTAPWAPGADASPNRPAEGLTLLSSDAEAGPSVIFIPSTLLVEIPGVGLDRLGLAQQYGGSSLTVAAVENAMGIEISGGIAVDDRHLGEVLDLTGGVTLDVPQRLVDRSDDGTGVLAFEPGEQFLPGPRLAQLLSFQQRGETELDTFSRQQLVLTEFLSGLTDDVRDEVMPALLEQVSTTLRPQVVDETLAALASGARDGSLDFHLLPVTPLGTTDAELGTAYQPRTEDLHDLVARALPTSIPEGGGAAALPIQVLNGVGRPGIGQRVDEALEGLGFRIALSDNARHFDYAETQIVIYEETPAMLAVAEQVRAAMGVGTILVSRQPQSVVDLTIVVGADFVADGTGITAGV